ncbi:MAG: hypothetical protein OXE77_06620 [Flavobacteriaceae bacterium]|nr:hypothetical protein [Flavobacteriaceae bacterium]MCY4268458.1 hypothetical protein [Flavobacteriaceae bacterium]MCY4299060.1 hypothetical protein [Flavobacteriaceae bacterium]
MNTIQYFKIVGIIYLSYYIIVIVWDMLIENKKRETKKHQLILSKHQPMIVKSENQISEDNIEHQTQKNQNQ